MKNKTCCFTGHRKLPAKKMQSIIFKLNSEVERLIQEGVTTFISGGALYHTFGFRYDEKWEFG